MMHKLQLHEGEERIFELMYEGFMGTAAPKSREEHAATKGVLKKLRNMSIETDKVVPYFNAADPLAPKKRQLLPESFELFDDAEWSWFSRTMDQVSTPAVLSDLMMAIFDKLDGAPKGDAKELLAGPIEVETA